jgi:hypothetical protein fuD12_10852
MDNKIVIFNKEIEIKEYNGERVITAYDIAELHGRDVKVINQQFNNNRNKFVENEDYFVANRNLIHKLKSLTLVNNLQNLKEIILFTDTGYLLLTKTFNDELSWKIQRELVKAYFKLKELKDKVESGELEIRTTQSKEINDKPTELQQYNLKRAELMIKAAEMMADSKLKTKILAEASQILTDGRVTLFEDKPAQADINIRKGSLSATQIAEIMTEKYGLYKFSAGSVGSICSTHGLKCEPYAYMHWNNDFQESGWRYFPEVIMKIWDIITSDEKKCKRYNIMFIDDEDF